MITWNESQIILAVVGMVGILSSFAVVQRSFKANDKFERRLNSLAACEVCKVDPCDCL